MCYSMEKKCEILDRSEGLGPKVLIKKTIFIGDYFIFYVWKNKEKNNKNSWFLETFSKVRKTNNSGNIKDLQVSCPKLQKIKPK